MLTKKDRLLVLHNIFEELEMAQQWLPDSPDSHLEHLHKAEALIELLEVLDCGSTGGYDPKSPVPEDAPSELYGRFLAVLRRYNKDSDIKKRYNHTVASLGKYLQGLQDLKETMGIP